MKAIRTQYFGPSNVKGSRIKATAEPRHSVTLSYDSALDSEANHAAAARALRDKMEWPEAMVGGTLPDGSMAWVFAGNSARIEKNFTTARELHQRMLDRIAERESKLAVPPS